jgi:DNA-binding XRE family transcriptional regulator
MGDRYWKRWGAELRHHRIRAGQTQDALGRSIRIARPTVGAFERGDRTPRREHAVAADEFLNAGGALVMLWDEVSEIRDIPEEWRSFEKVELQAVSIRQYHATLFPGLLQTREYALAVLLNTGDWVTEQAERLASERAERLDNLGRTSMTFVVNEVTLRQGHESWAVLRAQLDHVRALMDSRAIRLQVVPQRTLRHPCPDGSFRVMELRDRRLIGHEEYLSGVNVVTGPRVNELVTLFGHLQGEALSLEASAELIDAVRKEL